MGFEVEVFSNDSYPAAAAEVIALAAAGVSSMVLTGGTTAARIYPELATRSEREPETDLFFSDERCVPPDDDASNYRMATELLLDPIGARRVHRMRGELEPEAGAEAYHHAVADLMGDGFELMLLGMGADCHVAGMFPGSPALGVTSRLCTAVDRPDGMKGLTLTPPVLLGAKKILLLVTGAAKADAVERVLNGSESPKTCPARLLAEHDDVTFLLDESAARRPA